MKDEQNTTAGEAPAVVTKEETTATAVATPATKVADPAKEETTATAATTTAAATAVDVVGAEVVEAVFVSGNGEYTLASTVKQLQIDGIVHTREELLTNEAIMTNLIFGKSPFVKKL